MSDIKKQTFSLYKEWRKEKIYSPALEEYVEFTLLGWNHIVRPRGKSRTTKDVYRRLKILLYAKDIITKATTIQDIISKNEKIYYVLENIIKEIRDDKTTIKKVRVIILETKTGKKFYSIMDKKRR